MKRALLVLLVLCSLGVLGWGQFAIQSITGTWSQTIRLSFTQTTTSISLRPGYLELNFAFDGWNLKSKTSFGYVDACAYKGFGMTWQEFTLTGGLGPVNFTAYMQFNENVQTHCCYICVYDQVQNKGTLVEVILPLTTPAYVSSYFNTQLSLAGLNLGLRVDHWAYPYWLCATIPGSIIEPMEPPSFLLYKFCVGPINVGTLPDTDGDGIPELQPPILIPEESGSVMLYTLTLGVAPINIEARFVDCCTGIQFGDLLLVLDNMSLCCGITYKAELYFDKLDGFKWSRFKINNFLPVCCGITFDLVAEFGLNYKMIALHPKMAGLEFCGEIYYEIPGFLTKHDSEFVPGFVLNGWKIKCSFAECNTIEIMTVLEPPSSDPKTCDNPAWYDYIFSTITCAGVDYQEWEYIKISFCGAGCCGGKWTAYVQAFWAEPLEDGEPPFPTPTLFGLSRVRGSFTVPVMQNLNITLTWTHTLCTKATTVDVGWRFTF